MSRQIRWTHSIWTALSLTRAGLFAGTTSVVAAAGLLAASCSGGGGSTPTAPASIGNATSAHAILAEVARDALGELVSYKST
jgi:hypothetical protein